MRLLTLFSSLALFPIFYYRGDSSVRCRGEMQTALLSQGPEAGAQAPQDSVHIAHISSQLNPALQAAVVRHKLLTVNLNLPSVFK